jgi:hypothetical protein
LNSLAPLNRGLFWFGVFYVLFFYWGLIVAVFFIISEI